MGNPITFRLFCVAVIAILYSCYNAYMVLSYSVPEYKTLKAYEDVQASPLWENYEMRKSDYFSVNLKSEKVAGNYYYLKSDYNSEELYKEFQKDTKFRVLVDKNRYVWEVYSNGEKYISYEDVVNADRNTRLIQILKLLVSLVVAVVVIYKIVNREAEMLPHKMVG